MRSRALLIAGPTASGKSALALRLAQALQSRGGGAIVNADSMQIYRDLRILTARPSEAELACAPHYLYGVRAANEPCSAGEWAALAAQTISEICAQGRLPIVVGGTGLYFRTLCDGLSPIPGIDPEIRTATRALMAQLGPAAFHETLRQCDPAMGDRLRPSDSQRLMRAWEVLQGTGISLAKWQEQPAEPLISGNLVQVALAPPREWLYARCDARLDAMLCAGVLDEVAEFAERIKHQGLGQELPLLRAVGLAPLRALLQGEMPRDVAVQEAKTATRRYAKRQLTWIRNQMIAWNTLNTQDSESNFLEIFSLIIKSGLTD